MPCKPRQIIGSEPFAAIQKDYNRYCDKIIGNAAPLFFTPADLNPEFWVKADGINYQEPARSTVSGDTDPVGSYSDITSNARHFDQATTAAKPTTEANQFNGLTSVDFDGGDQVRSSAYGPPLDGITVAMALNPTILVTNRGIFEFFVDANYGVGLFIASGFVKCIVRIAGVVRLNATYGAIATGIQTLIFTIGDDKRTVEVFLNNVSIGTGLTAADITFVGNADVGLGFANLTSPFIGDIVESFKFNTVATPTERTQIHNYLSRWL